MRVYKRQFKEAFFRKDIEKAINLTCKILTKRTGRQFYVCQIPEDVEKIGIGKVTGLSAVADGGWMIRFNTKYNSASSEIISIDLWLKPKSKPDFTIDTGGISIVKIIDVIVNTFKNKEVNTYQLSEDVIPHSGGKKSEKLSASINAWFADMEIDENKLANTRIKHLYNQSYLYWYNSVRTEDYVLVKEASFRNYLIQAFEKNGITNIFMRTVSVSKGTKEKQIVDQKNEDEFDKTTYAMTLSDTIEYLKTNIRLVTRGFSNAILVCGTAGVGKTRLVKEVLEEDNVKYSYFSGGIKTPQALFALLTKHNDDNHVLVFDDADAILNKKFEDITKALLAPEPVRTITWYDTKYRDDAAKYKPQMDFKGRVIIISNKLKRKIPSAIISRTTPIEINVDIPDIVDNIRINLDKVMPEYPNITYEMKKTVLDFIEKVVKHIDMVDYRIFAHCVKIYSSGTPQWKKFIMPVLRQAAV